MTKQELQDLVRSGWQQALRFLVDHNPRAVYNYVQSNYPGAMSKWAKGYEWVEGNRNKLYDFVAAKAAQQANPGMYVWNLGLSVPYNDKAPNYTAH